MPDDKLILDTVVGVLTVCLAVCLTVGFGARIWFREKRRHLLAMLRGGKNVDEREN